MQNNIDLLKTAGQIREMMHEIMQQNALEADVESQTAKLYILRWILRELEAEK